jgi:starch synthase
MRIALVSSEAVPFSKTGGLADVAGTLFREYCGMGHDVSLFVPLYGATRRDFAGSIVDTGINIDVPIGPAVKTCSLFSIKAGSNYAGKTGNIYFVSNDDYFGRAELYGTAAGDYPDNAERFIFFCRSVLETCRRLGLAFDVLHCNDWQTGLVPLYLDTAYLREPLFENTRTMMTIHNLGYQGLFPPSVLATARLGSDLFTPEGIEFYGRVNFLKAGIISADTVTTVSNTYASEILTPEMGFGLDGLLRERKDSLFGVLNGIDYTEWNPAADGALPAVYSAGAMSGKKKCLLELMSRCSFTGSQDSPLLCFIGRLSAQKGITQLADSIDELMRDGANLFILGKGDAPYEKQMTEYARKYKGSLHFAQGFDDKLAHLAYAGSDIFLMPSVYEPCGLGQMISMRYGTIPVAFNTGGLADSITPPDDGYMKGLKNKSYDNIRADGFLFYKHDKSSLLEAVRAALAARQNGPVWDKMIMNAMKRDFSWKNSAMRYLELYKRPGRT